MRALLRITVTTRPDATVVAVEGRLAGPWVEELGECWRTLTSQPQDRAMRIELDAVTFIDASGKALLLRIHQQGAVLEASGCMTRAIVDEITKTGSACGAVNARNS